MKNSGISEKSLLYWGVIQYVRFFVLENIAILCPTGISLHVFYMSPQIGTNQIAVCAKAQNKPFYVVAESFKFVRLFPLNQQDVPDKFKVRGVHFFFVAG